MKKIFVGIDGSDNSDKALTAALDMADKYGVEVMIMNFVEPTPMQSIKYPTTISSSIESMANPE